MVSGKLGRLFFFSFLPKVMTATDLIAESVFTPFLKLRIILTQKITSASKELANVPGGNLRWWMCNVTPEKVLPNKFHFRATATTTTTTKRVSDIYYILLREIFRPCPICMMEPFCEISYIIDYH